MSTERDPPAYRVMNEIGIINQLASTAFTEVLPRNLSIAQFSILNHFVRLAIDYQSPAKLASAFQVSRPTMTNTLMRLEKSGFVTIHPDPDDKRAKRVSITEKGREAREEAVGRVAVPLREAQDALGPELIEKVLPLLTEMRIKLDALRD